MKIMVFETIYSLYEKEVVNEIKKSKTDEEIKFIERKGIIRDIVLKRLAKALSVAVYRNGKIEDVHAGECEGEDYFRGIPDSCMSQFTQAMADMGHQFWTSDGRLSMIGQGRNVVVLILLVFLVAAICARGRQLKLRIGCIGVLSLACFVGYNLMLALSYGFIFKPDQAVGLVDYNRYIYTYYIGWFFMALACWSTALQTADGEQKAPARRWIALVGQAGVLLMAAAMLVRVNGMILPQLSVLGFSDGEFADRKTARAEADWLCSDYLNENDRVFFVSQGDNGEHWFSAVFDFYPVLVDYSGVGATQEGGGGTFGLPELEPQEEGVKQRYYHPYTAERLDETVRANGCTVLYLQKIDDIFVQSYQNLFTDHLAAAQAGQTLLYRVTDAGYEPVTMQMSKEAAQ